MTIIPFTPNTQGTFQFQPTLDGDVYTCFVGWNLFGQRYYISCYGSGGRLIFNQPMVGSPLNYDINFAAGYFTSSTLVFRDPTQQFEIAP